MVRMIALLLLCLAYAPASRARQNDPRSVVIPPDSVASAVELAVAAPDSLKPSGPSPRGALWRGALVPGWGHIYTGRIGRLPFVYAALGSLAFVTFRVNAQYSDYRLAYRYKVYQEQVDRGQLAENPWAELEPSYREVADNLGPVSASVLKNQRDTLRRNRDLAILGSGIVWALSVLDAYVGAHMLDFDVSEDLSARVLPPVASPWPSVVLSLRLSGPGTR